MTSVRAAWAIAAFALSTVAGVAVAQPRTAPSVDGEVWIVLASEAAGALDPRLAAVPALRRPPFDNYRTMALLSAPRIDLRVGEAHELDLPNGRRMRIVLREITREGRFRMQVSINRPGQSDYLPELNVVASPGDPFFVAGQTFRDGMLVVGIRLGRRVVR